MSAASAEVAPHDLQRSHHKLLRHGLVAVGSLAVVGLVGEGVAPEALWRDNKTDIRGDGGKWLAFGGLGIKNVEAITREFETITHLADRSIDSIKYSDRGINKTSLGRILETYYNRHYSYEQTEKRQNILAHSMGWPTSLVAMQGCVERGVYVPPIDTIVALSSPHDIDDTYLCDAGSLIARSHYRGGLFGKVIGETAAAWQQRHYSIKSLGGCVLQGANPYHGVSPRLWTSQISLLSRDARRLEPGTFKNILTPDTQAILCIDPADGTVKADQAAEHIDSFLKPLGAKLTVVQTSGAGHANVAAACAELGPLL